MGRQANALPEHGPIMTRGHRATDLAVAERLGVLVWNLASPENERLRRDFETSDRRYPRDAGALRRSASYFAPRYYSAVGKASSPRSSGRR